MGTTAAALSSLATNVAADISATSRLSSDWRDDLDRITSGETRYQLRGFPIGRDSDSNVSRTVSEFTLVVVHHPASGEGWVTATAIPKMEEMAAPSYWTGNAGSNLHWVDPESIELELERIGNNFQYTVTFQASIAA